jgi:hypothetical protein
MTVEAEQWTRMELRDWCDQTIREWQEYFGHGKDLAPTIMVDREDIYQLICDLARMERELL